MEAQKIIAALVEAINAPTRAPALSALALVRYPMRELRPTMADDGTLSVTLALRGWEYKHHGPRPPVPPPVDVAAIKLALTRAMPDGVKIRTVENCGTYIKISMDSMEVKKCSC